MNKDDIILFMHFHKSAGTSINKMFENYRKFPVNKNGNPYMDKETIIHFWNFNKDQFNKFKMFVRSMNVNYVSLEWNFFLNEVDFSGMKLITCFREPYSRFISNLNFDKKNNAFSFQQEKISAPKYINKKPFFLNYNKNNYYVKILNGFGNSPNLVIDKTHLEKAKRILDNFDEIIIMEYPETFKKLEKYGINTNVKMNVNTSKKIDGGMKKDKFMKMNNFDYELYDYACKLAGVKKK